MQRKVRVSDTNAERQDKIAISSYGKSLMISMVDSCSSSSGGGVSSGGDKNDTIKSAAQFDG